MMVKKVLKDATLLSLTAVVLPLSLLPCAGGYARWRSGCLTSWGRQKDRNGHIGERETKTKGARRHMSRGSVRRRAVIPVGRGTTRGSVAQWPAWRQGWTEAGVAVCRRRGGNRIRERNEANGGGAFGN